MTKLSYIKYCIEKIYYSKKYICVANWILIA